MLVRVRFASGKFDYVSHVSLDNLIADNKITRFFRSGGWAVVGIDPIRKHFETSDYAGPERREMSKDLPLSLGLAKPFLKKGLYAGLIFLVLIASTLFGTALSAMLCPPVEDLEYPYSAMETSDVFNNTVR